MAENGKKPPERRGQWRLFIAVAVIAIVVSLAAFSVQMYRDCAFVCENTGSHKGYRQWRIGLRSGEWRRESRLEQFIRREHPSALTHRWTRYKGTGKDILGSSRSFEHGRPQISTIAFCPAWFDRYVDTLDDASKLSLYHLLVSGQREMIRAEEKKIEEMALAQGWDRGQIECGQ